MKTPTRVVGKQTSPIGAEAGTYAEVQEYAVLFDAGTGPAMTAPTRDKRQARRALEVTRGQVDTRAELAVSTVTIQRSQWEVIR